MNGFLFYGFIFVLASLVVDHIRDNILEDMRYADEEMNPSARFGFTLVSLILFGLSFVFLVPGFCIFLERLP